MNTTRSLGIVLAIVGLLGGCSEERGLAGRPAGSETTDELYAQVLDTLGKPLVKAKVAIRPMWYAIDSTGRANHRDTLRVIGTTTDEQGRLFATLPQGSYRIEVRASGQGVVIPLDKGPETATLQGILAKPFGHLAGRVTLPPRSGRAWVSIFGQDHGVRTDDSGFFHLQDLACGEADVLLSATVAGIPFEIGEAKATIRPHTTVWASPFDSLTSDQEDYATWRDRTTLKGLLSGVARKASPTGPVTALIRMDPSNFDFSKASKTGHDIRFALADGTRLTCRTRFYDSAAGLAHFDVRLPRLAPGDTAPSILVLSGRKAVPPRSDSIRVWAGIADSLRTAATSFLIDDFNPAANRIKFPADIQVGPWYLGIAGKDTLIQPRGGTGHTIDAIEPADSGRSGNALHVKYFSGDTASSSYIVIGTNLAATSRTFRAMDSIVFWARGNGKFWFAMEDQIPISRKAWIYYGANASWTRYRIRPSDFSPPGSNGNKGWSGARDSIQRISFILTGGSDFWIADVRLYGMGVDEMR